MSRHHASSTEQQGGAGASLLPSLPPSLTRIPPSSPAARYALLRDISYSARRIHRYPRSRDSGFTLGIYTLPHRDKESKSELTLEVNARREPSEMYRTLGLLDDLQAPFDITRADMFGTMFEIFNFINIIGHWDHKYYWKWGERSILCLYVLKKKVLILQ